MTQTLIEKLEALIKTGGVAGLFRESSHVVYTHDLRAIIEEYKVTEQEPFGYVSDSTYEVTGYGTVTKQQNNVFKNPVFTHPQLSDETVKDAERYRWLRSGGKDLGGEVFMYGYSPKGLDESIDEAMKAERENAKG